MKRNKDSYETSGTTLNVPTSTLKVSQKEKREKGPGKPLIFEEIIASNLQNDDGNAHSGSESAALLTGKIHRATCQDTC